MPTSTDWSSTTTEALRDAGDVLGGLLPPGSETAGDLRASMADARLAGAASAGSDAQRTAVAVLLAELLARRSASRRAIPAELRVVQRTAEATRIDPCSLAVDVAARALRDPRLLALPPAPAIEALLALVLVLAPVEHVSLWRRDGDGGADCVRHAGPGCPTRTARDAAAYALSGAAAGSSLGARLQVVPVPEGDGAVLVARASAGCGGACRAFLREVAIALGPPLDRLSRLQHDAPFAELLANASERRLTRIGFDLHDGPVQTLAALLGAARMVHSQVADTLGGDARRPVVLEQIDDLTTRIVALEFEMRGLCHSLESPTVLRKPLERVIEQEIVTFQRLTGVIPEVEISGRFEELTPSQRIALIRVVQESLRNVREHSRARHVTVRISTGSDGTDAVVTNDGPGFDVDEALARALEEGRLGLIGMMERVRLLGGDCGLRSRSAGPTTVSVRLPRWQYAQAA